MGLPLAVLARSRGRRVPSGAAPGPAPVPGAWDLSNASLLAGETYDAATTTPILEGIFFKDDGTKMYLVDNSGITAQKGVDEYDLGTAWDPSTASYVQSFGVSAEEGAPMGVYFKPDGTKMYVTGSSGDEVNEYNLSSAWDVSSATHVQAFDVSAQEATPRDVFFKPDGTKMYVMGDSGDDVNEYDLSTAWDVSSASYLQAFSVSAQDTGPEGLFFKPDGTKMYVSGVAGDTVEEYDLSTAWDVSSASHVQSLSVAAVTGTPVGIFFKPDGAKLFLATGGEDVFAYSVSTA